MGSLRRFYTRHVGNLASFTCILLAPALLVSHGCVVRPDVGSSLARQPFRGDSSITRYDRRLHPFINRMAQDMQIGENLPARLRIDTLILR